MKKTKLFKSLLVAAGLCVGASAWADTYFSQNYEADGATADWTSGNTGRYTVELKTADNNTYLQVNAVSNGNNGTDITCNATNGKVSAKTDFYMSFDLILRGGNNQASSFYIYDATNSESTPILKLSQIATGNYYNWTINDDSEQKIEGTSVWCTFEIARKGNLQYLTITKKADNTKLFNQALINNMSENGGLGKMVFHTKRYYSSMSIDNVLVRSLEEEDTPPSQSTSYTIKYQDTNGTTLKDDVVVNSIVDIEVSASADQMAAIEIDEKRYIYQSGNTPITTVADAASNIITLVYREAAKWSWTATAKYGETALDYTQSGEVWEDQNTIKIAYPRFLAVGTQLVGKAPINNDLRQSATITENNSTIDIVYTAVEGVNNLYLFSEAEDLGTTYSTNSTTFSTRVSNGQILYASQGKLLDLPTGKYIFTLGVIGGDNNTHKATYEVKAGENTISEGTCTGNFLNLFTGEEFTLAAASTPITFTCSDPSSNRGIDLIYIQKTSTPAEDKALRVFSITGLNGDWNTELDMTQSSVEGEEDIYTATTTITVTDTYSTPYKLHQDHAWTGYQLPQDNTNYTWTAEDGIGIYTLTFTADVANHTLTVAAEKADFTYAVVGCTYDGSTEVQSELFSAGAWNTNTSDVMTKQADGTFVWMKNKVELPAKWIDLKVIARNGEDVIAWFGDPNNTQHNQNVGLNINETGAGIYNITVTFNGSTVTATAEKQPTATIYFVNDDGWTPRIWVWDANNDDYNYTGGVWNDQPTMTLTGEQIDGKDVYSWSTYELNPTPTTLIISNNLSNDQRFEKPFVNGATYRPDGSSTVSKTISAAGYATFCSASALDFTDSGLTAYIAKKDADNKVTFTAVTKVPAQTGVLLKGEAGDYAISTTTDATDDVTGNVLIGVLEDTQVGAGSFVLMNGDAGVGFYKTANAFTVGANTAYIEALPSSARFIGFDFDNTTTAIEGVVNVKADNGEIYNLQGQRVVKALKGLYIINGKKVVVK